MNDAKSARRQKRRLRERRPIPSPGLSLGVGLSHHARTARSRAFAARISAAMPSRERSISSTTSEAVIGCPTARRWREPLDAAELILKVGELLHGGGPAGQ